MRLSGPDYLIGCATTIVVLTALGWGALRVRRRVVPEWVGALARTAEVTIAVSAAIVTSQLLALGHLLRPLPTLAALLVAATAMAALGSARPAPTATAAAPRSSRLTVGLTIAAGAALVAQWAAHTAVALDAGMSQLDTLYYHGPYSARFLQEATIGDLAGLGTSGSRLYPLDTELLHTLVAMPFGTDLLSPLVNLALLAVLGVAAWAIGQPRGLGAVSLLGALVVASFPAFVATQAGQASSDLAAAAFLLSSVAMLVDGRFRPPPLALAGMAAGLAVGSKLSVAAPVAALTVGVLVLGLRRHRRAAAAWCLGLVGVVGGWFIRNWVLVGTPLPWFDIHVGPVRWPAAAVRDAGPLLDTVTDRDVWRTMYLPELPVSMGRAWPLALLVLLGGAAVLVVRGRGVVRLAGAAVLVAVAAHVVTPQTGGLVFGNNLRFLHPALLLGGALLAVVAARMDDRVRNVFSVGLAAVVLVNLVSPHTARVPMWPRGGFAVVAVLAGIAVIATTAIIIWARRDGFGGAHLLPVLGLLAVAAVVAVGWPVQQRFLEHRYETTNLARIDLYRPFRALHDERVAVLGQPEVYPMFGPDLSNDVSHLTNKDRGDDGPVCLAWREALVDRYDYVAILPYFIIPMDMEADELIADPAATVVARNEFGTVYRIDGRLATDECAADQAP